MKSLIRMFIVIGLITVLTPCECMDIARVSGNSCHSSSNDCCGSQEAGVHASMDLKASLADSVQVPPPVIVIHAIVLIPSYSVTSFIPTADRLDTGPPPSFNSPLLI